MAEKCHPVSLPARVARAILMIASYQSLRELETAAEQGTDQGWDIRKSSAGFLYKLSSFHSTIDPSDVPS